MTTNTTPPPPLEPGRLLTIKDIQTYLSCSHAKAWNLVKAGHLTRVRFGPRMTRFRSEEALALMERGTI